MDPKPETSQEQPQPAPASAIDVAVAEMIKAIDGYLAAVDMIPLSGPERRQVDDHGAPFQRLRSAAQGLQAIVKQKDNS